MSSGPRAGPTTVYCGAYRDSGDCGFGLRGAELARCYEVHSASTPPSPLPAPLTPPPLPPPPSTPPSSSLMGREAVRVLVAAGGHASLGRR